MAHAMTRTADAMTGVAFVARVPSRPAPTVRTYRRRRLAVLLAAIATFLVAPVAASRAVAAFRDVPASVPERRPAPATGFRSPDRRVPRPAGRHLVVDRAAAPARR